MAKGFKKAEIEILIKDDDSDDKGFVPLKIIAQTKGGLAFHKARGKKSGWAVTHIASGMTIDPYSHAGFGSSKEAQDYIQFALSLEADWTSDLDWKTWWENGDPPPPPLDTIRHDWTNWWDEECQRRNRKQEKEEEKKESNPIFELFGS